METINNYRNKAYTFIKNTMTTAGQIGCSVVIADYARRIIPSIPGLNDHALNLFLTGSIFSGAHFLARNIEGRQTTDLTNKPENKAQADGWLNRVKMPAFLINFFTTNVANKLLGIVAGVLILREIYFIYGSLIISTLGFLFWTSKGVTPCVNTGFTTPCCCKKY